MKNRLIEALPPAEASRLAPHMVVVDMERGRTAHEAGDSVEHVLFPLSGVISLMTLLENGGAIECGMVGNEGAVGLPAALRPRTALVRAVVQAPTRAIRVSASVMQEVWPHDQRLRALVDLNSEALYIQAAQSVACNASHSVEERLCRWLLSFQDRLPGQVLRLTQEYLADMMGVQRTTITAVARHLQARGAIRYRRGQIEVVDRQALELCACECYGVVRRACGHGAPGE
ncbi:MAG TPA: Crp/Fnr family transcriptional regulator, partial [Phenylobacterium sp.]|nr:Crp/Fnr family transcriptional regulator [Phenylobacterium sp.]